MSASVKFRQVGFPHLHAGNHRDTGPADRSYNCIAWATGVDSAWWEPRNLSHDYKTTALVALYESLGFIVCADGSLEDGFEKIAIYSDGDEYMHAARQLEGGKWTSKMGPNEDIEHHSPEDIANPCYGNVSIFMKRPRP